MILSKSPMRTLCNINLTQAKLSLLRTFSTYKNQPQDDMTYRGGQSRRTGYQAHHHEKGLLPRLKIKEKKLDTMPTTAPEDPWSPRLAREGENDFVKIFSDNYETIEQHDLLTHIPDWLRGYRANNEYSVSQRRRREFQHWRVTKPQKWRFLENRIKYLYKMINNKYKPPGPELLKRSRHRL